MFPTRVGMNRDTAMAVSPPASMFPTRVGMNRARMVAAEAHRHVPHTRGDEPMTESAGLFTENMFPTRVGMNRD